MLASTSLNVAVMIAVPGATPVNTGDEPLGVMTATSVEFDAQEMVDGATRTTLLAESVADTESWALLPAATVGDCGNITSATTVEPIVTEAGVACAFTIATWLMPTA